MTSKQALRDNYPEDDVLIENPPAGSNDGVLDESLSLPLLDDSSSIHPFRSGDTDSVTSSTDSLLSEAISDDQEDEHDIEARGCLTRKLPWSGENPPTAISTSTQGITGDESDSDSEDSGIFSNHQQLSRNVDSLSDLNLTSTNRKRRRQQDLGINSSYNSEKRDAVLTTVPAPEESVILLGSDISHLSRAAQFLVCASGVFGFNLLFGYLQELINVEVCNRNLGLFLAMMQFAGYTLISFFMRTYALREQKQRHNKYLLSSDTNTLGHDSQAQVPSHMYWTLGILSGIDMAMTNMSMHYLNYPAKTLLKSSRVVFTMFFGVLIAHKKYRAVDYAVVMLMIFGLCVFMQADRASDAIFDPIGVLLLTVSLLCDGATNIMSETIMKTYGVGQDELIFRMYSLALVVVTVAATWNGELREGMTFMMQAGTYDEWQDVIPDEDTSWSVMEKIFIVALFSSMGFFGSSCSAAITKNFGALTMSITSTARRATTLFISFFLFDNECTYEHITGVVIFITALTTKSFLSRTQDPAKAHHHHHHPVPLSTDLHVSTLDFDLPISPQSKTR